TEAGARMTQWPRRGWFTLLALVLSLASCVLLAWAWISHLPLVERYDMPAYIRTSVPAVPFWATYTLVAHDGHLATPEEAGTFYIVKQKRDPARLHYWMRTRVYYASLWWVLRVPLGIGGFVGLLLLIIGGTIDRRYNSES